MPGWSVTEAHFGAAFYYGNLSDYNYTQDAVESQPDLEAKVASFNNVSRTEDCLFLDISVPKKVFDKRSAYSSQGGAPVLVW